MRIKIRKSSPGLRDILFPWEGSFALFVNDYMNEEHSEIGSGVIPFTIDASSDSLIRKEGNLTITYTPFYEADY